MYDNLYLHGFEDSEAVSYFSRDRNWLRLYIVFSHWLYVCVRERARVRVPNTGSAVLHIQGLRDSVYHDFLRCSPPISVGVLLGDAHQRLVCVCVCVFLYVLLIAHIPIERSLLFHTACLKNATEKNSTSLIHFSVGGFFFFFFQD